MRNETDQVDTSVRHDRRQFLGRVGKFAAITPPVVTLMLAGGSNNPAVAYSGFGHHHRKGKGHRDHNGKGHGHHKWHDDRRWDGHDDWDGGRRRGHSRHGED